MQLIMIIFWPVISMYTHCLLVSWALNDESQCHLYIETNLNLWFESLIWFTKGEMFYNYRVLIEFIAIFSVFIMWPWEAFVKFITEIWSRANVINLQCQLGMTTHHLYIARCREFMSSHKRIFHKWEIDMSPCRLLTHNVNLHNLS